MPKLDPKIIAAAQAANERWRVPASVSLAQFALESAWGKHTTGPFNYFGMKCPHGMAGVWCATHEVEKGRVIKTTALFRAFANPEEAFMAHAQLLATAPVYREAQAHPYSPEAYAHALTGVYATDPHYGDKLVQIMRESRLEQYDRK